MSLINCVVQSSFYDPPRFFLFTLELKELSLIHVRNYESGLHQSHLQGKPTCSPALPNQGLLIQTLKTSASGSSFCNLKFAGAAF